MTEAVVSALDLPDDAWRNVALHLTGRDMASLALTCRALGSALYHHNKHTSMNIDRNDGDHDDDDDGEDFYKLLLERDRGEASSTATAAATSGSSFYKKQFILQSLASELRACRWFPIQRSSPALLHAFPSSRECHVACLLGEPGGARRKICITGGFVNDPTVYIYQPPSAAAASAVAGIASWDCHAINPTGTLRFVYGSSLTALDANRAIQFGGFYSGGYTNETNDISILTILETNKNNDQEHPPFKASWSSVMSAENSHVCPERAFHTATLIHGRYLVVLGGMITDGSIIGEAILDTETMSWLDVSIVNPVGFTGPSGRHGCSVVLDEQRNRLVMFGGATGSDLLRSGSNTSEVWELKMGENWKADLEQSFPWKWEMIFSDREDPTLPNPCPLSAAEALCIGRCHNGIKTGRDTVLFTFGSAHPSTNGLLGYDLSNDTFIRPRPLGGIPRPQFCGAAVYLEESGYVLTHGGWTGGEGGHEISDMNVLDVAPALGREFQGLAVDTSWNSRPEVTEEDVRDAVDARAEMMQQRAYMAQLLQQQPNIFNLSANNHELRGQISRALALAMINGDVRVGFDDDDVEFAEEEDDL